MVASLIVVAINAVFGTIIAWLLVRDDFPGKAAVNAVIDLPFALPTIVASLTLLDALRRATARSASTSPSPGPRSSSPCCFVTLPFVVRAVQPLLIEMDREMEEAAASLGASGFTVFRRIIFPNLLPGLAAGVALAFARALGEFGSVLIFAGGLPDTQVSSVFIRQQIESGNDSRRGRGLGRAAGRLAAAAARRVSLIQRWGSRHERSSRRRTVDAAQRRATGSEGGDDERVSTGSRWGLRTLGLGYLTLLLLAPLGDDLLQDLRSTASAPPIEAITSPDGLHALKLTLLMVAIAVPLNTVFGVGCALLLVRHKWKGNAVIDAIINLPFAISPIVIGLSLFLLYGTDGWFGPALWPKRASRSSSRCRAWSWPASSSRCPSSCARPCRCCRRSAPSRSRPPRPSAPTPGRPSGGSPCRRSAGASPTASC